jgi:hypothetical protein
MVRAITGAEDRMRDRELNLNVRVTEEERAKLHALADDRDLSASTLLRHMVREAYTARFGTTPPKRTKGARR